MRQTISLTAATIIISFVGLGSLAILNQNFVGTVLIKAPNLEINVTREVSR